MTPKEEAFLNAAQALGFLTPQRAEECRNAFKKVSATGLRITLVRMAQDNRYLTADQVVRVTQELSKEAPTSPVAADEAASADGEQASIPVEDGPRDSASELPAPAIHAAAVPETNLPDDVRQKVESLNQRLAALRKFAVPWGKYSEYVQRADPTAKFTDAEKKAFASLQEEILSRLAEILPTEEGQERISHVIANCSRKMPLSATGLPAERTALLENIQIGTNLLTELGRFLENARRDAVSQSSPQATEAGPSVVTRRKGIVKGVAAAAGILIIVGVLTLTKERPRGGVPPRAPLPVPTSAIETTSAPAAKAEREAIASAGAAAAYGTPAENKIILGEVPFRVLQPQDFDWPRTDGDKPRKGLSQLAGSGVFVEVADGERITKIVDVRRPGPYFVFVRCLPTNVGMPFTVQLGRTVIGPVDANRGKGPAKRWARVGPFNKLLPPSDCELALMPTPGHHLMIDRVAITGSPDWRTSSEETETFQNLKSWDVPGEEVLTGCDKLNVDPPAYRSAQYIVQAPSERICKAMGWAKHVELTIYPVLLQVLGYTPNPNLHALIFCNDFPKHPEGFTEIGKFGTTDITASQIWMRCATLDSMPPYPACGDIVHETIRALLNGVKNQADWKPMGQPDLLDLIFEMELCNRLKMKSDLDALLRGPFSKDPRSRQAVLVDFWKQSGWQPFQKLILKLHENPDFKPAMDEETFVCEMSLGAGKDVSGFFEKRGWSISPEAKGRIKEALAAGKKTEGETAK